MIRLLLRLLGIRDFEVCSSCETLKQQLEFERAEKKELTATLLNIIKPKEFEAAPIEVNPIQRTGLLFSQRRAALEAADRERAKIINEAKNIGKPDITVKHPQVNTVEQLENELGIEEKEGA